MICERCGLDGWVWTGSYFNTQTICEQCDKEEQQHPDFARAKEVECEAVKSGDLNFPGIGLPADLQAKADARYQEALDGTWHRKEDPHGTN